jgi:hypothetical protein
LATNVIKVLKHSFELTESDSESEHPGYYICIFSGYRPPSTGHKHGELGSIRQEFFLYPSELDQALSHIEEEAGKGREVYFCAHLLTQPKRQKQYAAPIICLYVDGDKATVTEDMPKPTLTLETSPGRYQYFYKLNKAIDPYEAERLNKKLANAIDADLSGWDLTQVMRLPDTQNHKYEGTPTVKLKELREESYDPDQLKANLLPLPISENTHKEYTYDNSEPPVVLEAGDLKVWNGEKPKYADNGEVDRSASLLKIGRVLFDAGATRNTILNALRERDKSLGWSKYTDRPDSEKQYHKIVDELESKGRNTQSQDSDYGETRYDYVDTLPLIEFMKLGEIAKNGIEPPEELVPGIIQVGKTHRIVSGAGNGKTWLALYLAKEVITQGKTVLYLDKENGSKTIVERLFDGFNADSKEVDELLYYAPFPSLSTQEGLTEYVSVLDKIKPSLIIFDSWIGFLSDLGYDENSNSDVAEWCVKFLDVPKKQGIAVVILDHVNKDGKEKGASKKRDDVAVQWDLKKMKPFDRGRVGEIELKLVKDRDGWFTKPVRFSVGGTKEGFVFLRSDEAALGSGTASLGMKELTDKESEAYRVLKEKFGSKGAADTKWKNACMEPGENGMGKGTYYRAKNGLLRNGHVIKKEKLFYPAALSLEVDNVA